MVCFVGNAMWTWEECTFYSFLIEYAINIYYIKLINSEFLVKYILSYILPAGPSNYWKRTVNASNHSSRFLVAFRQFLSLVFQDSIMRCMHIKIVMSFWRIEPFIIMYSKVAQSGLTLRDPIDCSLPCSSVHGIFQARVLEWVAISFSNYYVYPSLFLIISLVLKYAVLGINTASFNLL